MAFESLYSIFTSASETPRIFFKIVNGFFGIIKSATCDAVTSVRAYFTNLWASVATNVNPWGENWKNTPDITGRKSSFPAAKMVLLMAVAKTSAGTKVTEGSSKFTDFGNSSPGA